MGKYFEELTGKMKKIDADFLEEVRDRFGERISDEILSEMKGNIFKMERKEEEVLNVIGKIDNILDEAEDRVSEADRL